MDRIYIGSCDACRHSSVCMYEKHRNKILESIKQALGNIPDETNTTMITIECAYRKAPGMWVS